MKTTQLVTLAVAAFGMTTGALARGGGGGGQGGDQGGNAATTAATTAAAVGAATTTADTAVAATTTTSSTGGDTGSSSSSGNTGSASGSSSDLTLDPANVQAASDFAGNPAAGQALSLTDPANFIDFCTGKTLTNGTQNTAGSCNGVVMGDIPSNENMVSAIVTFPGPGQDLTPNTQFNVSVQLANLQAGVFTDPLTTYYAAPQQLNSGGQTIGHCHVTIQDLGNSLAPTTAPDAKVFAFFKGIDDAGNGQGLVQAVVTAGLPAGFYRICTINSASNHQSVLSPVAQRGGQDDCQKFTVGQGTGNAGSAAGGAAGNAGGAAASSTTAAADTASTTVAAAGGGGNGGAGGAAGAVTTSAAADVAATTTAAAAAAATTAATGSSSSSSGSTGSTGRGGSGGRFGGGRGRYGRGRFAARDLIV